MHTYMHTYLHSIHTCRQANKQAGNQANKQTRKQGTNTQTNKHTQTTYNQQNQRTSPRSHTHTNRHIRTHTNTEHSQTHNHKHTTTYTRKSSIHVTTTRKQPPTTNSIHKPQASNHLCIQISDAPAKIKPCNTMQNKTGQRNQTDIGAKRRNRHKIETAYKHRQPHVYTPGAQGNKEQGLQAKDMVAHISLSMIHETYFCFLFSKRPTTRITSRARTRPDSSGVSGAGSNPTSRLQHALQLLEGGLRRAAAAMAGCLKGAAWRRWRARGEKVPRGPKRFVLRTGPTP